MFFAMRPWWVPAWFVFSTVATTLGALIGVAGTTLSRGRREVNWTGAFAKVAVAAVLLLLMVGGMVTSEEAGLAVVDWPNSFGTFMFLLPLSRMTGGTYFEHSHRLIGSLVGLATLILAIHLWRTDPRARVRRFIVLALLAVIAQGVLGGLRVTGHLTLSHNAADVAPKTSLAIIHGVFGQVVFGLLTAVAVLTSTTWYNSAAAAVSPRRRTDRLLSAILVVLLVVQLTLGALVRHLVTPPMDFFKIASHLLLVHVALATIVVIWAVLTGARAWGFYGQGFRVLRRFGLGSDRGSWSAGIAGPSFAGPYGLTVRRAGLADADHARGHHHHPASDSRGDHAGGRGGPGPLGAARTDNGLAQPGRFAQRLILRLRRPRPPVAIDRHSVHFGVCEASLLDSRQIAL